MYFADIHNHLLPDVDDGSRSMEESLRALRRFRDAGVTELVVTPHLNPSWGSDDLPRRMSQLREAYDRLRAAAAAEGGLPAIHFGQEVLAGDGEQLSAMLRSPEVGLAGTRFLLVEFGFELGGEPEEVIEEALAAGRQIVVAHPERYRYPAGTDGLERIRGWHEQGAFLQVNLGSLTGYYDQGGGRVQTLAWRILGEGLAHLVSTDDHGENRPQTLHGELWAQMAALDAAEQARLLMGENARRILRGEAPRTVAPLAIPALPGVAA